MKLVVGLGNPGAQYSGTRHNVGFDVIAELGRRWQFGQPKLKFQSNLWECVSGSQKVLLAAPLTFMNRSGEAVQQLARFYQIPGPDLLVICDDMNLPTGQLRWRAGGSSGGQKGLGDILQRLGTEDIPRLRIGIGRPPGEMDPVSWVLGRFRPDEQEAMEISVRIAADSVELWLAEGVVSAMNRYNRPAETTR